MDGEDREALEDAVALVASMCGRHGVTLTRTKLVKLLYFVDVRSWERSGRVVTGVEWMWHYYGPYSAEIVATCNRMSANGELDVIPTSNYYGSPEYRIRTLEAMYFSPPEVGVVELVREVVQEFGGKPAAKIGDLSYETLPMRHLIQHGGRRGDVLEFPSSPPTDDALRRTASKYARILRATDTPDRNVGDVAEGLREDVQAHETARKSATTRQLIG